MTPVNPKQIAAEHAVSYVQDGMVVGLGTRSTANFAIAALGERIRNENLSVRCIPTSDVTAAKARAEGIPLTDWARDQRLDLSIDGADEVDPELRLIKGGGGALVREKIVAAASTEEIIIVDASKLQPALGAAPLPVAVVPFGWEVTRRVIEERFGKQVVRRLQPDGAEMLSDDGLVILDIHFGAPLPDPDTLEARLKEIVGVAEVGLFVGLCQRLVIGYPDGRIEERLPAV